MALTIITFIIICMKMFKYMRSLFVTEGGSDVVVDNIFIVNVAWAKLHVR